MSAKTEWMAAVRSREFPAHLRVLRGTLLCLGALMTSDGELRAPAREMCDATGLPPRTLGRHLAKAVEHGWLSHIVRGGNGRGSRYRSCRPHVAGNASELSAIDGAQHGEVVGQSLVPNSAQVVGHLVANSIRHRASFSERVAVDERRGTRLDHVDSRGVPRAVPGEKRRLAEDPAASRLAAVFQSHRGPVCKGLRANSRYAVAS